MGGGVGDEEGVGGEEGWGDVSCLRNRGAGMEGGMEMWGILPALALSFIVVMCIVWCCGVVDNI